jgi:ABC-2 type transport system permease protein
MREWGNFSLTTTMQHSQFFTRIHEEWSSFIAMARKELIIMARYPVNFITSFGQTFLIVAVFTLGGSMFFRISPSSSAALPAGVNVGNPSGVVVYGFILFMFMNDTLWTIGYNIRNEQVQGTLEQLYLSPSSKFANLVARVTNTLIWTSVLCLAAAALMTLIIGKLPIENPLLGAYLLVMGLAGTFGIGFAFAALTLRIKETAQTVANFLQFFFLVLCANFFPFSALPPFIFSLSRLLPPAYSVDAFRSALMGFPPGYPELAPFPVELVIVTVFGIIMPPLGYLLYRRAENYARKHGSLSTY